MEDLIKDYMNENFTLREWVIYGVLVPAAFVFIAILL